MAKSPTTTAQENLTMLDFLTMSAIDAGMIDMDDLRRFRRRLRLAQDGDAKARLVNEWVETIGQRLTKRLRHRMPPNMN